MAIFKANVKSEYAQIPNSTLQDKALTFEAKGLLAMMLSLPENWEIHKSWLQDQAANCGRDKLTRLMKELQEAGYVRKQMKHREDGKFSEVDWYVFPTAQLESRSTAKPSDGKPATTKETVKQKKQVNKETSLAPSTDGACSECVGLGYHGLPDDKCNNCSGTGKETPTNPDQPSPSKAGSESDSSTDKGVRRTDKSNSYPDEFEWLWKHKPGRIGANPKKKAYSACKARLKSGSSWREMAEGMKRYTVHCQSEGKLNTQYVMQMATFFGPDEHFKEQWSVQQPQEYQAPGSEQAGVDAPIYPSQIKNFSSANQTDEGQHQNEKIRQGLGSLRSQLNGEAK